MKTNINGKTVLITGAGSGIGKAIALRLAEEKANIVLLGGRTESKLRSVREELTAKGANAIYVCGDLTDNTVREKGIAKALDTFGGIDILINNAGSAMNAPFDEVSEEQYDEIMTLDVKVPYFLTQKVLPYLKKSDHATVINIASVVGHLGYPLQSAYAAAKHALIGFTKSMANELYKDGVRVHVISPGGVLTDMVKLTRPDLAGEKMIVPEDIAETVAFLLLNRTNAVIDEIMLHRVGKAPFGV